MAQHRDRYDDDDDDDDDIEEELNFNCNTPFVRHTNTNTNEETWILVSPILRIFHAVIYKQRNNKIRNSVL